MENRLYPVSHQQRKLYLQFLAYGPRAFNITFDFQFYRLDKIWVERALENLLQRHEILRTTYDYIDGEVFQKIHPTPLQTVDIKHFNLVGREERDIELGYIREELDTMKFDLNNGPIVHLRIIEYSEEVGGVLFCINHIAADQYSALLIKSELETVVARLKAGETGELPLPKRQIRQYVEWTQQFVESEEGRQLMEAYKSRVWNSVDRETNLNFSGKVSYAVELSTDLKKKFGEETPVWYHKIFGNIIRLNCVSSATYTFFVDELIFPELKKLRAIFQGGLSILILAVFVLLFSVLRKTKFVRICIPSSVVRVSEDWRETIGWLTGEIIFCHEVDYSQTLSEFMADLLESVIKSAKDQLYYFEKLLYHLDFPVNVTAPALINIITRDGEEAGAFEPVHTRTNNGIFEFESAIVIFDDGIGFIAKYDLSVYSADRIEDMFRKYLIGLRQCAESSGEQPICELLKSQL